MDLRQRKTIRSIKNAFLKLRAKKPLERITIRELAQQAEISKATFYLHYQDIYDLSDQLQNELIQMILEELISPDGFLLEISQLAKTLEKAFYKHQDEINILFSGSQASVLPERIEQGIKEHIFSRKPELKTDLMQNVALSFQIYGSYYAYWKNCRSFESSEILNVLDQITDQIRSTCWQE